MYPYVSYQVLINDSPSKGFAPNRGLQRRDPLSLHLFCHLHECAFSYALRCWKQWFYSRNFLLMIAISSLMLRFKHAGHLKLFFLIFGLSGLQINFEKSEFFLSPSLKVQARRWYSNAKKVDILGKYLSLELGKIRRKENSFTIC